MVVQTPIRASGRSGERSIQSSEEEIEQRPAGRRRLVARLRKLAITWAAGPRTVWWSSSQVSRPSRTGGEPALDTFGRGAPPADCGTSP